MEQKKDSFLKHYLKGEALFGFWGVATEGVGIISTLLVISLLDVYGYGLYLLIIAFFSLVADAVLSPLTEVIFNDISRFVAENREDLAKRLFWESFFIRMSLAFLVSLGVFLGAGLISRYYDKDIANLLRIVSPLFLLSTFYVMMRTLLKLRLKFGLISSRPFVYELFRLFSLLIVINFFSLGVQEALVAHVISVFLATLVFVPSFLKYCRPWRKVKAASKTIILPIIKAHGKWPLFSQTITSLTTNIRPWLIKFFVNTEAVAFFSVSESILGVVKIFFPINTLTALVPRELTDHKKSTDILVRGTRYFFALACLLTIGSFLTVPLGIKWFFPKYLPSVPLFQILIFTLPLLALEALPQAFLFALRKQKFFFFVNIFNISIRMVTPIVLLPFLGIWGMPIERVLAAFLLTVFMCGYLFKLKLYPIHPKEFFIFNKKDKHFVRLLFGQTCLFVKNKYKSFRPKKYEESA